MKKSDVTFQQLDLVLHTLNFKRKMGVNAFGIPHSGYVNTEYDAVILVPLGAADEFLLALDLHSVEKTIENRGVLSRQAFAKLLNAITREQKQAA